MYIYTYHAVYKKSEAKDRKQLLLIRPKSYVYVYARGCLCVCVCVCACV